MYGISLLVITGSLAWLAIPATALNPQLKGMTVAGYQGWYPIKHPDGSGTNFKWFSNDSVVPGPIDPNDSTNKNRVLTDVLPYTHDYPTECLENTNFILADGVSRAQLFSSYCDKVISAHFVYMKMYHMDGIFVQRFLYTTYPSNAYYTPTLNVLNSVQTYSETYTKAFAIEYDLSGLNASQPLSSFLAQLNTDYANNVKPRFSSPSYIYNGTRPVIGIFGVGFSGTLNGAYFQAIIENFLNKPENPYIVLSVPWNWMDYLQSDPKGYIPAIKSAQSLMQWPVGAWSSIPQLIIQRTNTIIPSNNKAISWNMTYGGAITPGGSNRNARGAYDEPFGNRYNGTFFEEQLKLFSNTTVKPHFNFIAMFDEYTEGSQILPMLHFNELPSPPLPGFFGTDNDMDVFFYMNTAGAYTTKLHTLWSQTPYSP